MNLILFLPAILALIAVIPQIYLMFHYRETWKINLWAAVFSMAAAVASYLVAADWLFIGLLTVLTIVNLISGWSMWRDDRFENVE